ncbi:transcription termination factor MTERF6, chloroplastic/mitochondrial-like [Aristolochia californica]|uniref:transcription termination factor MTERF6, chloroplastic/mitochondrial-like n=1 Tax=Aristolochia californica TaxID=171875 RepID=UPI0035DADF82
MPILFRNLVQIGSWSFELNHSIFPNFSLRSISSLSNAGNESTFTYSYLVKSCGLSPDSAHSAAQKLNLKDSLNSDLVLTFFRDQGFTKMQIKTIVCKSPALLAAKPSTTLKPKFEFLRRLGLSRSCVAKIVSGDPSILRRSVASHMVSSIAFLRTILHTDENIISALKRSTRILVYRPDKIMPPNIEVLTSHSVPLSNIAKLVKLQPGVLMGEPSRLNGIVLKLKDMGFAPLRMMFIRALRVSMTINKLNWEKKLEAFRSLGWSDDEILAAIRVEPFCMANSEKKIRKVMEYFVKEWGFEPSAVSKRPIVLALSLEKRIVPRCSVLQVLQSKGLIKSSLSLFPILELNEKKFLEKFIIKYKEEAPEILKHMSG